MKKMLLMGTVLALCLGLCGCFPNVDSTNEIPEVDPNAIPPQNREELYSYYDQIQRGMTRVDVEKLFGKGAPMKDDLGEEKYTAYRNDKKSSGVNVLYDFEGKVYAKVLYYNKSDDLRPFASHYDAERLSELDKGKPLSLAEKVFGGPGLEIVCQYSANSPTDTSYIHSWLNDDGSNVQLHSQNGVITQVILNRPQKK